MHDGLVAWLRAAADRLHEEAPALTALDQAIGDGDHATTAAVYVAGLEAAAGGIAALGKATEGEKTMLDALYPAARAARAALEAGGDLVAVSAAARDAAQAGSDATIPMLATKGRASYLGERSVGHRDPGATSSALLLATLAATVSPGD